MVAVLLLHASFAVVFAKQRIVVVHSGLLGSVPCIELVLVQCIHVVPTAPPDLVQLPFENVQMSWGGDPLQLEETRGSVWSAKARIGAKSTRITNATLFEVILTVSFLRSPTQKKTTLVGGGVVK